MSIEGRVSGEEQIKPAREENMDRWQKEADKNRPGFFRRLVGEKVVTFMNVAHEEAIGDNKAIDAEQDRLIKEKINELCNRLEASGKNPDRVVRDIRNTRILRLTGEDEYELAKAICASERLKYHEIIIDEVSISSLYAKAEAIPDGSIVFVDFRIIPDEYDKGAYEEFDDDIRARSANSHEIQKLIVLCPEGIHEKLPTHEMFIASRTCKY